MINDLSRQQDLVAKARGVVAEMERANRWTLWVRLSFAMMVSEATAHALRDEWATWFRARVPGAVILSGIHSDSGRLHVHALIYLPLGITSPRYPAGVSVIGPPLPDWPTYYDLDWPHGHVWADWYRRDEGARKDSGAGWYSVKDPGSYALHGQLVPYVPESRRRRATNSR